MWLRLNQAMTEEKVGSAESCEWGTIRTEQIGSRTVRKFVKRPYTNDAVFLATAAIYWGLVFLPSVSLFLCVATSWRAVLVWCLVASPYLYYYLQKTPLNPTHKWRWRWFVEGLIGGFIFFPSVETIMAT